MPAPLPVIYSLQISHPHPLPGHTPQIFCYPHPSPCKIVSNRLAANENYCFLEFYKLTETVVERSGNNFQFSRDKKEKNNSFGAIRLDTTSYMRSAHLTGRVVCLHSVTAGLWDARAGGGR